MRSTMATDRNPHPDWFRLGEQLFRDGHLKRIRFIACDLLVTPPEERRTMLPAPVASRIRVISAFAFFHLFSEAQQLQLARTVWSMLEKQKAGNMIFGIHKGMTEPTQRSIPEERQGQDVFFW